MWNVLYQLCAFLLSLELDPKMACRTQNAKMLLHIILLHFYGLLKFFSFELSCSPLACLSKLWKQKMVQRYSFGKSTAHFPIKYGIKTKYSYYRVVEEFVQSSVKKIKLLFSLLLLDAKNLKIQEWVALDSQICWGFYSLRLHVEKRPRLFKVKTWQLEVAEKVLEKRMLQVYSIHYLLIR